VANFKYYVEKLSCVDLYVRLKLKKNISIYILMLILKKGQDT